MVLTLATACSDAQTPAPSPSWWASYGVISGTTPNDYAAANQGEAKNMALAAVSELDNDLAQFGGSGLDYLTTTVLSGTSPQENDYAAINLGQLKTLSKPFFDRLLSLGYTGPPLTSGTYPWVGGTANDYALGNIGQLKFLFSFDVTYSSSGNGIPDWWSNLYYPGQTVNSGSSVQWDSQVTILQAFQNGWNPKDFYNGQPPILTIVSGSGQTGSPGGYVPLPLVVSVTDSNGNGITGAPVAFNVTSGGGYVQPPGLATASGSAVVLADQNGQAEVYFLLPTGTNNTSQIVASTGTGTTHASGTFTEFTDNGTGTFASPFTPSNCMGAVNSDGSLTFSWTNNTNGIELYIVIEQQQSDGTWQPVSPQLPPGTTSYTMQPSGTGFYRANAHTPDPLQPGDPTFPGPNFFFPIPDQSYAAINISGTTATTNVWGIGLDDNNNAAFAFNVPNASGTCYSYTWQNGTISSTPVSNLQLIEYTGSESLGGVYFIYYWRQYVPEVVFPDGTLGGSAVDAEEEEYYTEPPPEMPPVDSNGYLLLYSWDDDCAFLKSYDEIGSPSPYISYGPPDTEAISYSPAGTCGAFIPAFDAILTSTGDYPAVQQSEAHLGATFFTNGESFLWQYPIDGVPVPSGIVNGTNVITEAFNVQAINDNDAAVGYDGSNNAVFWSGSGSTLAPMAPMDQPIAINNLSYVVGGGSAGGYLWTSGTTPWTSAGSAVPFNQFISPAYQPFLSNIEPIDISGTDANGSLRILFSAQYQPLPTGPVSVSGTFLLTLTGTSPSTSGSSLQVVSLPSNVNTNLSSGMINAPGVIADVGTITTTNTNGSLSTSGSAAILLLPVDVSDYQDSSHPKHLQPLPPQQSGQSNAAYDQQPVADGCIAYITGSTANPLMPVLVASLPGAPSGIPVKWRLEVDYDRGNGYSSSFDQPVDTVTIPSSGDMMYTSWTNQMDSSQQWQISASDDWTEEIAQNGFFGGTAKLYLWLTNQNSTPPTAPIITFRIGGQNPVDQDGVKTYIDAQANTVAHPFWYAYMIARKESAEYVPDRYYNQFFATYVQAPRAGRAPVGLGADMDWVGWANAWPTYNYDRWHGHQNGPGGYGMFQLTLGPKQPNGNTSSEPFITRGEIWNWQDNVNGAVNELAGKVALATTLYNKLAGAFPSFASFAGDGCFSAKEAFIVALYNGGGALKTQIAPNGTRYRTPWLLEAGQWQLESDYVNEVEGYE